MSGEKWHTLAADECLNILRSGKEGLSSEEAAARLNTAGYNELEKTKKASNLQLFLGQFKNLLIGVLIAAALISLILGEIIDAAVIFVIVILNSFLGFYQERKAENALEALKKLSGSKTTVFRNKEKIEIESKMVVPGDVIILSAGDKVPADCRIIEQQNVKIDESPLTGESVPSTKTPEKLGDLMVPDRIDMAFSGTSVVYGNCVCAVCETGMRTEFGKIAKKLQEREEPTPLQRRLEVLGKQLTAIILLVACVVFIAGYVHGLNLFEMFLVSVSLAVAAIPEGMPAIVTITLAIGLMRMSRRKAIVRRLPSTESLGSVTVICSDKTGTLTKNEMTVVKIYAGEAIDFSKIESNESEDGNLREHIGQLLLCGMLCNNASMNSGDPTEIALVKSAKKFGIPDTRENNKRLLEIPFDSSRKMMSVIYDAGGKKMFMKGAVEEILSRCNKIYHQGSAVLLTNEEKNKILLANTEMTKDALRVLAFAYRPIGNSMDNTEDGLTFLGLQAMIDPPRSEVKDAIAKCYEAGIKVIMITGDHQNTAEAIAREIGIQGEVITGSDLEKLDDEQFEKRVKDIAIYARTSPDQKSRICDILRKDGNIVAMSGDGINDAPALKKADVGIAVGSGTDVTKEAADIVLVDDNFSTIVSAIEEGRGIYANIKKFVNYLLCANFSEILIVFTAVMLNFPLPLLPLQLLWINITTDGLPALALGVEPPEKDIMKRKPRDPKEKILNKQTLIMIVLFGALIAATTLMLFNYYLPDVTIARSVAFTSITITELILAINFRSRMSIIRIGFFSNRKLMAAILTSLLLHLAVLYLPIMNVIFDTAPLGLMHWVLILTSSAIIFFVVELVKGRFEQ